MKANQDRIFEAPSGNVFADFGIPEAYDHLAKADLAVQIRCDLDERHLTQTAAATLLGTSQARISELYNGRIAQMTYDRLLGFLNLLDYDVQITITPRNRDRVGSHGRTLAATG